MSGRLPDPGLAAICARCGEPREAHGGAKHLGACPDQSGLRAHRFQLRPEDKPTEQEETPIKRGRAVSNGRAGDLMRAASVRELVPA